MRTRKEEIENKSNEERKIERQKMKGNESEKMHYPNATTVATIKLYTKLTGCVLVGLNAL